MLNKSSLSYPCAWILSEYSSMVMHNVPGYSAHTHADSDYAEVYDARVLECLPYDLN